MLKSFLVTGLLAMVAPLSAQQVAILPAVVASPAHYSGNCPGRVEFVAHVTVTIPGTEITYRWERSTGDSGKVMRIQLGGPRTANDTTPVRPIVVAIPSDFWRVGLPSHNAEFWELLHIESPVDIRSAPARVTMECRD